MDTDIRLREYAEMLHSNGFDIYEPEGPGWTFFHYCREVDGRRLWGYVQRSADGYYEHLMPIRPSREHGSNMIVPEAGEVDALSLAAAKLITRSINTNDYVGTHENYDVPEDDLLSSRKWGS